MYCANCGKELVEGANFCTACGSKSVVAERMAAVAEAAPEEAGGVSTALASGRSRSRLRMSPLVLLVLVLALTAGIAAAAIYVYAEIYLPSSNQEMPVSPGDPLSDNMGTFEADANHFATDFYDFDLPEYWRDRVVVMQDGTETTIYAKEGYDAGYEMQLAHITISPGVGGGYGDVSWRMILDEEIMPRIVIKVGAMTPALLLTTFNEARPAGSTGEITFLTAEAAAEIAFPDVPRAILSDYIDLSTGGVLSFEDLDSVDSQFVSENACYARYALPPLITLNDAPSEDAIEAAVLDGWYISADRTNDEYRHFTNGVEYVYQSSAGGSALSSGYRLVSSRQLVSLQRNEEQADNACWIAAFDDGGMYWIYDIGLSSFTYNGLHDHARSSASEKPTYYKTSTVDDGLMELARVSE